MIIFLLLLQLPDASGVIETFDERVAYIKEVHSSVGNRLSAALAGLNLREWRSIE